MVKIRLRSATPDVINIIDAWVFFVNLRYDFLYCHVVQLLFCRFIRSSRQKGRFFSKYFFRIVCNRAVQRGRRDALRPLCTGFALPSVGA